MQNAALTLSQSLAITRGHTHRSLFFHGQSARVLCTKKWLAEISIIRKAKPSTGFPMHSVERESSTECDAVVPFFSKIRNTGAIFSLSSFHAENASVNAVDDEEAVESLPRSNDFNSSTALRHQSEVAHATSSSQSNTSTFCSNSGTSRACRQVLRDPDHR
jgi:hypothetical protein